LEITTPGLTSIDNGVTTAYNTQLYRAQSVYKKFTYAAASTGADEVYPGLDMIRGPREWIGARAAQELSVHSFTIKNKKFEQTIRMKRDDIEDDKYGLYNVIASEIGQSSGEFPELLIAQLLQAGTTTQAYDGQNFFDPAHPTFTAAGAPPTAANYFAGSSPGWYLMDNSRSLKPLIFQTRSPFNLTTRFNPDDPSVFDNDEFLWGTRGRMNAGFGLWQLAAFSTLPLTVANITTVRVAMASLRRPDGTPMGIRPNVIVVPTVLHEQANSYFQNGLIANNPASPTTLVENTIKGMYEPVEFPWLN
jgi:phage major head subunit gpT-like protein